MRKLNCKRMPRMISLYVAGDLVGGPEREVTAHLAACEACRQLAQEFSESSSLLTQACAPPEFGAEFYSGIRHAVLGEISRDRMLSKPSLFRRRWLYATAFAAVVIAVPVMLQHFGSIRREAPQGLADQANATHSSSSPGSSGAQQSARKPHELRGTLRGPSHKVLALVNSRRSPRQFEMVRKLDASGIAQSARDKRNQTVQAMQSPTSAPTGVSPVALESATSGGSASSPFGRASQVSRIEIQTADPNIRIIWLGPRESRESEETNHDQHNNGDQK